MHKAVNVLIYGCKGEQWSVLLYLYGVRNLMETVYQSNNRTPYNKMICIIKTINTTRGIFMQFKTNRHIAKENDPRHDKTIKMSVRPAKTQISLGICPIWSVFAVRMKKAWVLSYPLSALRRLCSDWADAQADVSLRWAQSHFVGFVMSWLKCFSHKKSWMTWNLERIVLNWDLSTSDTRTYAPENQV